MNRGVKTAVITLLTLIYVLYACAVLIEVNDDAGYYLSVANLYYLGYVPMVDISSSYTPLGIYIIGIPYILFNQPLYEYHVLVNVVISALCAIVTYRLLSFNSKNKLYNFSVTILVLAINIVCGGAHITLEPISLLFQLFALYFFKRNNDSFMLVFISGLFVALSFLAKQYGIFVITPILFTLFNQKNWSKIIILFTGVITPILILYLILLLNSELSIPIYVNNLIGRGVQFDVGYGTNSSGVTNYVEYMWLAGFGLWFIRLPRRKELFRFEFILLISAISVLMFAQYWHYFIYIFTYLALFGSINGVEYHQTNVSKIKYIFSIFCLLLYTFLTLSKRTEIDWKLDQKSKVLTCDLLTGFDGVYLDGLSPKYYYWCELKPIDLVSFGYTFPNYIGVDRIIKALDSNEAVVVSIKNSSKYEPFLNHASLLTIDTIELLNRPYLLIYE